MSNVDVAAVLKEKAPAVNNAIEKLVPRKYDAASLEFTCGKPSYAADAESATKALSEPIWDLLDRGGKRWRPALFLLTLEALGKNPRDYVDFAAALEIMHNGCVTGDTLVLTGTGVPRKVTDVAEGELVFSYDAVGNLVKRRVLKKYDNGVKQVYSIRTNNREVVATANHPFLTARKAQPARMQLTDYGKQQLAIKLAESETNVSAFVEALYSFLPQPPCCKRHLKNSLYGCESCLVPKDLASLISVRLELDHEKSWKEIKCSFEKADIEFRWTAASDLRQGDLLVVSRDVDCGSELPQLPLVKQHRRDRLVIPAEFSVEMAQLAGFLLGDGYIDFGRVILCLPEGQPGRQEYVNLVTRLFKAKPSLSAHAITCCSKALSTVFTSLGLAKHALEKTIPAWVYRLPRSHKLAFVKGYLDADGYVDKNGTARFECASKELIAGLKVLLDSMGFVTSNIFTREVDNTHFKRPVSKKKTRLYCVCLYSKEKTLREIGTEISSYRERLSSKGCRQVMMRYSEQIPSLPPGFTTQLGFSKVISVTPRGNQNTYDLTVEETHNYVGNGVVIHNSLLVDDVEDSSELRRGKPCIHKTYGVDVAINAGNAMYFLPFLAFFKNKDKVDEKTRAAAYELVLQEMLNLHFGQGWDIWWHRGGKASVSEKEYLQMCAYKTGTLARMAARLAALLAGADQKKMDALGKFAEAIGIAFQIQDDLLNISESELSKGKGLGDDIHEGKRTLMVIHALSHAPQKDAARLKQILASHPSDQQTINEAIEIMRKAGSLDYARAFSKKLVKQAWAGVDSLLPQSDAKDKLKAFADYLVERNV